MTRSIFIVLALHCLLAYTSPLPQAEDPSMDSPSMESSGKSNLRNSSRATVLTLHVGAYSVPIWPGEMLDSTTSRLPGITGSPIALAPLAEICQNGNPDIDLSSIDCTSILTNAKSSLDSAADNLAQTNVSDPSAASESLAAHKLKASPSASASTVRHAAPAQETDAGWGDVEEEAVVDPNKHTSAGRRRFSKDA